ncbi:MAG: glycosyltransferase [archaeon]
MIPKIQDYQRLVGKRVIEKIKESAEPLQEKHIVHINATSQGGGVAEILNTMVFLMNNLGIDTGWRILLGSQSFFKITKGMHNSLQGKKWKMSKYRKNIYLDWCQRNSVINHIEDHDIVVVHDPQPLGMIENYEKKTNWVWRCHIDTSHPYKETMDFLRPFIKKYDATIISSEKFRIKGVRKPQFIIPPSIDPLARKNKKISHKKAIRFLKNYGIDSDKPIISQISRFDPWKDHFGVLKMFEKIKQKADCQLVLMGNMATDDPQGPMIYHKIQQKTEDMPDVKIITEHNDLLVNALQQESAFVFQNSIREGFALTVSEALWKKTPVLGTAVGGIPLQIQNGRTGYLIKNRTDGIEKGIKLLKHPELRRKLGQQGHEHVKKNFLITRHLQEYLDLFNKFYPPSTI